MSVLMESPLSHCYGVRAHETAYREAQALLYTNYTLDKQSKQEHFQTIWYP